MDLRDIHVLICTKIGSASVGHRLVDMVGAGILGIAYSVGAGILGMSEIPSPR